MISIAIGPLQPIRIDAEMERANHHAIVCKRKLVAGGGAEVDVKDIAARWMIG